MYSKFIFLVFTLSLLIACDSTENNPETDNPAPGSDSIDQVTEAPKPDRDNFFNEGEQALLGKYIDVTTILELSNNMYALGDAKTDAALEKAFITAQGLQEKMEKAIGDDIDGYQTMEILNALDSVMPPYTASCAAECTMFRYTFSFDELMKYAEKTEGKSDDSFCNLMKMAEGDFGGRKEGWYKFIARTWDYGGGSVLGDESCFDFLKASWEHTQTTPLFRAHLDFARESCLEDMAHPIYMQKKKVVVAEVDKILAANILSAEEKTKLESLKTKLEKGTDIQFNCSTGNCDFGG